jgi:hypothetical protein
MKYNIFFRFFFILENLIDAFLEPRTTFSTFISKNYLNYIIHFNINQLLFCHEYRLNRNLGVNAFFFD